MKRYICNVFVHHNNLKPRSELIEHLYRVYDSSLKIWIIEASNKEAILALAEKAERVAKPEKREQNHAFKSNFKSNVVYIGNKTGGFSASILGSPYLTQNGSSRKTVQANYSRWLYVQLQENPTFVKISNQLACSLQTFKTLYLISDETEQAIVVKDWIYLWIAINFTLQSNRKNSLVI